MVINLNETIPYYVYSHLQQLQDFYDELAALQSAKFNAELAGAMLEDLYGFDIEIESVTAAINELKAMAN